MTLEARGRHSPRVGVLETVLRTELQSSGRALGVLNCWAVSPDYNSYIYFFNLIQLFSVIHIIFWIYLFIFFICISNFILFPHFPSTTTTPIPSLLPLPTNPPTTASLSWHSPTLGPITSPRASPLLDVPQVHSLLHMRLEPWVPPCVLFGWWFSPWELWSYWLVHIVVPPMELPTPSAPCVLS